MHAPSLWHGGMGSPKKWVAQVPWRTPAAVGTRSRQTAGMLKTVGDQNSSVRHRQLPVFDELATRERVRLKVRVRGRGRVRARVSVRETVSR